MANLLNILHIGQTGTEAAQFGVRVSGQNISNVSTPGYHRRVVKQEQAIISPTGVPKLGDGVRIIGAERIIDTALDRRARDARSESLASQTRFDVLSRANVTFGDLVGEGLSPVFDDLLASFDELATSPQDIIARRQVVAAANLFALEVRRYASELEEIIRDVDSQLKVEVDRVNSLIQEIADANRIIQEEIKPSPDMLDRRDRLVADLSEQVETRVVEREDGSYDVHVAESGYTLVAGRFSAGFQLETRPEGVRLSGYGFGGARSDLTNVIKGGKIGGLLIARDVDLTNLSSSLDSFAFEVANSLNTIHSVGFGLDGETGRDMFVAPTEEDGAAVALQLSEDIIDNPVAIAAAQTLALAEGGNGNALALSAFRHDKAINGLEPTEALQTVLQEFGDAVYQSEVNSISRGDAAVQLQELQQSLSGVSLDEELTNLIRYQQAYAAAAQVMRTADELVQELLTIKR